MAIVFTKNPAVQNIQNAFNNVIVEFNSNAPVTYSKCEIEVTYLSEVYNFVITPIDRNFYFNLKQIASKIAKKNNFKDELTSIDIGLNPYDLFFLLSVEYTIVFDAGGTETSTQNYNFYKSVMQINNPLPSIFNTTNVLDIVNYADLTMFKGFPFDVSIYTQSDVTIKNEILQTEEVLTRVDSSNRLFLSNGLDLLGSFGARVNSLSGGFTVNNNCANVSQSDLLKVGANVLKLSEATTETTLNIDLKDSCGVYLRYFNNYGNYSYWLFEDVSNTDLKVQTKGTVNVDFQDINETYTTELTTGKLAEKFVNLRSKNLDKNKRKQLESLFTSPRIDLYLGKKGEAVNDYSEKWETVILQDGTFTQGTSKRELSNISVTIRKKHYTI